MSSNETISIRGRLRYYNFQLFSFSDSLQLGAGVYVVMRTGFGIPNPSLIYVGETTNLHQRFLSHEKQQCFDENRANKIGFLSEMDINNRLSIEKDICLGNNPICNDGC